MFSISKSPLESPKQNISSYLFKSYFNLILSTFTLPIQFVYLNPAKVLFIKKSQYKLNLTLVDQQYLSSKYPMRR